MGGTIFQSDTAQTIFTNWPKPSHAPEKMGDSSNHWLIARSLTQPQGVNWRFYGSGRLL